MNNAAHWRGRHVVVTGGTSGIGLAVVGQLLAAGALVSAIGLADTDADKLLAADRPGLVVATADVRDADDLASAVAHARSVHGSVGALITCAGVTRPGYFADLDLTEHRRQMDINYFGTLHAVRTVLPDLLEAPGASITCMSSVAGFLGVFGYSAYCASKFAVSGLCESLRQELRPRGISVTVVCPPDVDTPMLHGETPLKPVELLALSSGKGALRADDVASALLAGTVRRKATVLPGGAATRATWLAAGATPTLLAKAMDFTIARATKRKAASTPA